MALSGGDSFTQETKVCTECQQFPEPDHGQTTTPWGSGLWGAIHHTRGLERLEQRRDQAPR